MLAILIDTANMINERSLMFSVLLFLVIFFVLSFRCFHVGSSKRRNKVFSEIAAV